MSAVLCVSAVVALGVWLDSRSWTRPRVYFAGRNGLADCVTKEAPRLRGGRHA